MFPLMSLMPAFLSSPLISHVYLLSQDDLLDTAMQMLDSLVGKEVPEAIAVAVAVAVVVAIAIAVAVAVVVVVAVAEAVAVAATSLAGSVHRSRWWYQW